MVVGGQKTKTIHSVLLAFKNAVVQKYDDKILNILKLYGHSRINLFFQLKMFDREDNKTFILNHLVSANKFSMYKNSFLSLCRKKEIKDNGLMV